MALLVGAESRSQSWEVFNMASPGLPSNTVLDIITEADGTVWVATDWGLCRGQAGEWQIFNTSNSGLPDNSVRCLALDQDSRLWVGTSSGGAVIYDGSTWEVLNTMNSPLPDDQVNTIHLDHQGWMWLGTVSGLACFTGTEWHLYNSSPSSHLGLVLNGDHILSIASRTDGLMALGTLNGGFHFLTDTLVQYFTTFNSGFFDNTQHAVLFDTTANERWLACPAGGLVRQIGDWYGGSWFPYTAMNSGLPSNALKDVILDGTGGLWLAAQVAGLIHRSAAGSYSSYLTSNSGIPSNALNCLHRSGDGSIWMGTYDGGAARFNPSAQVDGDDAKPPRVVVVPLPDVDQWRVLSPQWAGSAEWQVLDGQGRLLAAGYAAHLDGLRLAVPGASPGVYFFRAASGRKAIVSRFMVH